MINRFFAISTFLFLTTLAMAQNTIQNPSFDTNVTSWTGDNGGTLVFDGANGDLAPGSGLVTGPGGVVPQCSQCVSVSSPGVSYGFGGNLRPRTNTSTLLITVVWFDGANCTGTITGQSQASQGSPTVDQWHALANNGVAPIGTVSARIEIAQNTGVASAQFNVDDVFLGSNDTPVVLQSISIE